MERNSRPPDRFHPHHPSSSPANGPAYHLPPTFPPAPGPPTNPPHLPPAASPQHSTLAQHQQHHQQHPPPIQTNRRTLPSPHAAGAGQLYQHSPQSSHGPPPQYPPVSHERASEHPYGNGGSGHVTPVARYPPEYPLQRRPSSPTPQQQQPPPMHAVERQPDGHAQQYVMTDPQQHHNPYAAPPPPPSHPGLPPDHHVSQPMIDPTAYAAHGQPYQQQGQYLYPSVPYSASKKKAVRASQACDTCRGRKSKCDERRPCGSCEEQGIECRYRDGHGTSRPDKQIGTVVTDALEAISAKLDELNERISKMEQGATTNSSSPQGPKQPHAAAETAAPTIETAEHVETAIAAAPIAANSSFNSTNDDADDATNSFEEHTTAAHKMVTAWPTIYQLLDPQDMPSKNYNVTENELRGPLRLYGKGEAEESGDSGAFGAASPTAGDDEPDAPTPPDYSLSMLSQEIRRSDPTTNGIQPVDGTLNLDSKEITRLFDNYKKHIHRLHPFLHLASLGTYIDAFITKYSPDHRNPVTASPLIGPNGATDSLMRGIKRKRSEPSLSSSMDSSTQARLPPRPGRSLANVIVYLVLALGKVCEAKDPLPGPLQDDRGAMLPPSLHGYGMSPALRKMSPNTSNKISGTPPGGMSDIKMHNMSPQSSVDSSPTAERKTAHNVDVIPGLAYYREACSILGDFCDSNSLPSAQARLLAGLYKGQLARVQESWSWLYDAARICKLRIRLAGLDKRAARVRIPSPETREERKNDILLLVTWSCLQLESDILAELDYPHSGLAAYEEKLPYPSSIMSEDNFPAFDLPHAVGSRVDFYYSAQLFLRSRFLNKMHANLYGVTLSKQEPAKLLRTLEHNDSELLGWRRVSSQVHKWNDDEPPSEDILIARMRAKYYGARYISTRPYLDYVLHIKQRAEGGASLEEVTRDARGDPRPNELALFRAMWMMDPEVVVARAKTCVRSAISSTTSLDNITERLVVTNIMGTAHAQFGNMLVLSAVYNSQNPWLSDMVTADTLRYLLQRTVGFLARLRFTSVTAKSDIAILRSIERRLFGIMTDPYAVEYPLPTPPPAMYASFGSVA